MENETIDEKVIPEEQQESEPSADKQISENDFSEKGSIPIARFKEVIEEKNSYKNDLERMREDIELLKAAKEPEPEPTTYQEVEERAVKKAMTQFEQRQAKAQAQERAQERAIESKFDQLKAIGQDVTPEIRKAILSEIVKTGNNDVVAHFLEVKKSLDKTSKDETRKKEGFIPPSHKGSGASTGYSYKEIKNKSMDQILDEAG